MPNNNEKPLPQFAPAVQPSLPGELMVVTEKVDAQGARLRLVPKPSAMDTALNLACAGRWKTSRYLIGRAAYCKLSIWDAASGLWIDRDAPDCGQYRAAYSEPRRAEEAGSLYSAMLHFGFWRDIAELPAMAFRADQVHIQQLQEQGQRVPVYRLAGRLTVNDLQRGERGDISRVVLRDPNGGVIEWTRQSRSL